jgi:hypothetical protein
MTVYVADAHAHVQTLVAEVKMTTVLVGCTTEEQSFIVFFLWARGFNEKHIHKKYVLFTTGSVCRVKRLRTG